MGKHSRRKRFERPETPQQTTTTTPTADGRVAAIIAVALALAVFAVFGQVHNHEFLNFDDPLYVTDNDVVQRGLTADGVKWAFTTYHASNWHPLTWLCHMTDVTLFGLDAGDHLLTNVLLHALNTILLFLLLRMATRRTWAAAMVAALFALHPAHVESVAWVSERKDVLSTFFFFLTLLLYVRYARSGSRIAWIFSIVSFVLGLMAKPMLVTLPFVLLLLDIWPLQRFNLRALWPLIREKLVHFALIIPSIIVTLKAQTEAMTPVPMGDRLANAAQSYVAYIGKMIWPAKLAAIYPYRIDLPVVATLAALAVLAGVSLLAVREAGRRPWLLTGWLWFLGTLVPVIGLVQVGQQSMADRYTYVPLVGLFIVVVWLAAELVPSRRVLAVVGAAVIVLLGGLTYVQAGYWKDSVTLFRQALAVTQHNRVAHTNLGEAYLRRLDYASAEAEFRSALAIHGNDPLSRTGLGIVLTRLGRFPEAERELRAALILDPDNHEVHRMLGRVALSTGRDDEAVKALEKSLALRDEPETRATLAMARGKIEEATTHYQEAVRNEPSSADLHNDLAAALARQGRDAEALAAYQEALRLAPHQYDAHMNLGALLSRLDRDGEATGHFLAAAKERPGSPEPHVYVALAYAKRGDFQSAERAIATAIEIDPVTSNNILTNAIRIPPKETNIQDYQAFLIEKMKTGK